MLTQHEMLLTLFREGSKLTVQDSMRMAGVYALSQRCGELREAGHDIKSKLISIDTRFGKKQVSLYWMEPERHEAQQEIDNEMAADDERRQMGRDSQ